MKYLINLAVTSILFLNVACSIKPTQPALHDFGVVRTGAETGPSVVKPDITVDAPKWLQDNRIRYRLLFSSPTQVRFYTLDRWIAPPPELMKQQLLSEFKIPHYSVIIRLLEFEQQFDTPNQARATMRFTAEAYSTDHKKKLGYQEFRFDRITMTPNAEGAVAAFSKLVRQANERIQFWLSGLTQP